MTSAAADLGGFASGAERTMATRGADVIAGLARSFPELQLSRSDKCLDAAVASASLLVGARRAGEWALDCDCGRLNLSRAALPREVALRKDARELRRLRRALLKPRRVRAVYVLVSDAALETPSYFPGYFPGHVLVLEPTRRPRRWAILQAYTGRYEVGGGPDVVRASDLLRALRGLVAEGVVSPATADAWRAVTGADLPRGARIGPVHLCVRVARAR